MNHIINAVKNSSSLLYHTGLGEWFCSNIQNHCKSKVQPSNGRQIRKLFLSNHYLKGTNPEKNSVRDRIISKYFSSTFF